MIKSDKNISDNLYESITCSKCKERISENLKYCPHCGEKNDLVKDSIVNKTGYKPNYNNRENKYFSLVVASVVTFIFCLLIFCLFYQLYLKKTIFEAKKIEKNVTVTDKGIADAVEKIYDAVVVIENYSDNKLYTTGTGFVFKSDDKYGYILTNYHVIDGGNEVKVVLSNDEKITTTVVGGDEYADIAILRIAKDDIISVASLGNSENMRVGDTTFAVGAPIDSSTYSWTVTRGILSGKNRLVEVSANSGYKSGYVMEVLQTDTAINSGNSGGPLCNANGEVIGITNMKLASSSIEGMGFAIPIEDAISSAENILNGTSVARPYLGITITDVTASIFNGNASGLYIVSVEDDSPASNAGLQTNDKILKLNDKNISNSSYFKYELYKYKVGDEITITYERDGKEEKVNITLANSGENT